MTITQLVVDLENEPGRLFVVTEALAGAGVNIHLLSVFGESRRGSLHMVVDDPKKARNELLALDFPARVGKAVAVRFEDRPGGLASVLKPLYQERFNLSEIHAHPLRAPYALALIGSDDPARVEGVLREHGFVPLELSELAESGE